MKPPNSTRDQTRDRILDAAKRRPMSEASYAAGAGFRGVSQLYSGD